MMVSQQILSWCRGVPRGRSSLCILMTFAVVFAVGSFTRLFDGVLSTRHDVKISPAAAAIQSSRLSTLLPPLTAPPRSSPIQPITVPSMNYTYPLCPWLISSSWIGYPRRPDAPADDDPLSPSFRTCVDRLVKWVREGKLIFSPDMGAQLGAAIRGAPLGNSDDDDLDIWMHAEKGATAKDVYAHCPEVHMGNHGWLPMPSRVIVGLAKYKEQYVERATHFCTCEFGGPFLCATTTMDDAPRASTTGAAASFLGPVDDYWGAYRGPTWATRKVKRSEQNGKNILPRPRGNIFWSVKYHYGASYWLPVPPSGGGKDVSVGRLVNYANPDHSLFQFHGARKWEDDTINWCHAIRAAGGNTSTSRSSRHRTLPVAAAAVAAAAAASDADNDLPSLIHLVKYVDMQLAQPGPGGGKLNVGWVFRMLHRAPCFLSNTLEHLRHTCHYLQATKAARAMYDQGLGDEDLQKVYEAFRAPLMRGLKRLPVQVATTATTTTTTLRRSDKTSVSTSNNNVRDDLSGGSMQIEVAIPTQLSADEQRCLAEAHAAACSEDMTMSGRVARSSRREPNICDLLPN